ncbi:MAG: rRNA synthase [Acidobacteriota bacterium]|jgi:23S rRNA pseudouridine1911/1915/1917 synthase|nr:rRNA synthase [Acidobacteriota bacterium]
MTKSLQFRVEDDGAGRRLDALLAERLVRLSRMHIASLLARGACLVNGAAAHAGRRLRAGDVVEVEAAGEVSNSMTPEPAPLEVVYEDEHIIVVVKPTGLLVHPTLGVKRGTLANALAYHLNRLLFDESNAVNIPQTETRIPQSFIRPGLVHRLDRDTSGLLVVAKTQAALSRLSQHFSRRLVEKRYVAVVGGTVEADALTIDAPIGRDEAARPAWSVSEDGKSAETRLRVLERGARRTLVELEPVTGRTNQLRIHCAHAGHAIVGDRLYAGDEHARLCLHAARLGFRHPATNEWTEFASRSPVDVLSALV